MHIPSSARKHGKWTQKFWCYGAKEYSSLNKIAQCNSKQLQPQRPQHEKKVVEKHNLMLQQIFCRYIGVPVKIVRVCIKIAHERTILGPGNLPTDGLGYWKARAVQGYIPCVYPNKVFCRDTVLSRQSMLSHKDVSTGKGSAAVGDCAPACALKDE